MEERIGNLKDAELIFERAIKQFPPGTEEKMTLWRAFELMEQRAGNDKRAQEIYSRSMRETFDAGNAQEDEEQVEKLLAQPKKGLLEVLKNSNEFEVIRWDTGSSMKGDVWMNNGSIEGKVPEAFMGKNKKRRRSDSKAP
jgi:hypothetical protein